MSSQIKRIELFINRLPEECSKLVMRAGDKREDEAFIDEWDISDEANLDEIILEIDALAREEETKFRLIPMNEKGKQMRGAKTFNPAVKPHSEKDPIGTLIDGVRGIMYQAERLVAVANDTIEKQQDTIDYLADSLVDSRQENVDNELAVALLQMEKDAIEEVQSASVKERALNLAESVASKMIPQKLDADMLLRVAREKPEFVAELLENEELKAMVLQAATKKKNK